MVNLLKSRKFLLVLIAMALLSIGGGVAAISTGFADIYAVFGGFILSALAAYLTGNVVQKRVAGSPPRPTINEGE